MNGRRVLTAARPEPEGTVGLFAAGAAELRFDAGMFARTQTNLERTRVVVAARGDDAIVNGLTIRLDSQDQGTSIKAKLDSAGMLDSGTSRSALKPLVGEPVFDAWTVRIDPGDNPSLVHDGALELGGLKDVVVFLEYTFDYRS